MKNAFYFDHDYSARNDQKILELRAEFGWEGYAIFFALLECMCESKGYIKREALAGLSLGLNLPKERLIVILDFMLKIPLLFECENGIYSQRILEHIQFREMLSVSGSKGGRGNKKPPFSPPLAPLEAGEESKGEESKEKNKKYSQELIDLNERCKAYFDEKYVNEKSLDCFNILVNKGYEIQSIKKAILNGRNDEFWSKQFQSPLKLNKKDKCEVLFIDVFLKLNSTANVKDKPKEFIPIMKKLT